MAPDFQKINQKDEMTRKKSCSKASQGIKDLASEDKRMKLNFGKKDQEL